MKNSKEKNYWLFILLLIFSLCLIALITFVTISSINNNYAFLYGFLLCLSIPFLFLFVDWLVQKKLVVIQTSKPWTIFLVTILHIVKYSLFFVLPLCGFLVNKNNNNDVFNIYGMIVPLVITVMYIICRWIIHLRITKKNISKKEYK